MSSSDPNSSAEESKPQGSAEPSGAAAPPGKEASTTPQCPLCAFIEAGPCKEPHQSWGKCRDDAKEAGHDYVDACSDMFKAFLQCAVDNEDYYEPFLDMLMGTDRGAGAESAAEDGSPGTQAEGGGGGGGGGSGGGGSAGGGAAPAS